MFLVLFLVLIIGVVFLLVLRKFSPVQISKPMDVSRVCPISHFEDDFIVNGNGDISAAFDLVLPDIFSISESDADSIHDSFLSVLKILPVGTVVHKQDLFFLRKYDKATPDASPLRRNNEDMLLGRPTIKQISRIYVTFPKDPTVKTGIGSLISKPNYLFRENVSFDVDKISKLTQNFSNSLNSVPGFTSVRLTGENLLRCVHGYFNASWGFDLGSDFSVDPISVDDNGNLKIGDRFLRVVSLTQEGPKISNMVTPKIPPQSSYNNGVQFSNTINAKTSFMFPLANGFPVDHVLNTKIQILDNDNVLNILEAESRSMGFLGNFYAPARNRTENIHIFSDAVVKNGYQCCSVDVNVVIRGSSIDELDTYSSLAQQSFMQLNGSRAYVENFDTANIFFSCIPGSPYMGYRSFYTTFNHASCYVNLESMLLSDKKGVTLIDRFGSPVVVDLFTNKKAVNRNEIIIGPSGSGKSFALNELVSQHYDNGAHIIIIDIGYSYKLNCELRKGVHFDASDKSKLSFNLFQCPQEDSGKYLYKSTDSEESFGRVDFITTAILFLAKGTDPVTPIERGVFKLSVSSFFDYCNQNKVKANFTNYYNFLPAFEEGLDKDHKRVFRFKDLKILLDPFVFGEHKTLLNSDVSVDITDDRFIVFDLEAVEKDPVVFPILCLIIIDMVIQKMYNLPGEFKYLLIDEALNFLQNPIFGDFIAFGYRTFRKKNGKLGIASQNVKFLDAADPLIRDSIIINSAYNVILDHSEHRSNYKDLQRILSLSDHQISQIDSLEKTDTYREIFVRIGKFSNIYRMQVSPFAFSVYANIQSETKKIVELTKKYGSLETALYQHLDNKINN